MANPSNQLKITCWRYLCVSWQCAEGSAAHVWAAMKAQQLLKKRQWQAVLHVGACEHRLSPYLLQGTNQTILSEGECVTRRQSKRSFSAISMPCSSTQDVGGGGAGPGAHGHLLHHLSFHAVTQAQGLHHVVVQLVLSCEQDRSNECELACALFSEKQNVQFKRPRIQEDVAIPVEAQVVASVRPMAAIFGAASIAKTAGTFVALQTGRAEQQEYRPQDQQLHLPQQPALHSDPAPEEDNPRSLKGTETMPLVLLLVVLLDGLAWLLQYCLGANMPPHARFD